MGARDFFSLFSDGRDKRHVCREVSNRKQEMVLGGREKFQGWHLVLK